MAKMVFLCFLIFPCPCFWGFMKINISKQKEHLHEKRLPISGIDIVVSRFMHVHNNADNDYRSR